jgi:hypothetical protein
MKLNRIPRVTASEMGRAQHRTLCSERAVGNVVFGRSISLWRPACPSPLEYGLAPKEGDRPVWWLALRGLDSL